MLGVITMDKKDSAVWRFRIGWQAHREGGASRQQAVVGGCTLESGRPCREVRDVRCPGFWGEVSRYSGLSEPRGRAENTFHLRPAENLLYRVFIGCRGAPQRLETTSRCGEWVREVRQSPSYCTLPLRGSSKWRFDPVESCHQHPTNLPDTVVLLPRHFLDVCNAFPCRPSVG